LGSNEVLTGLVEGLAALGYAEGKNIVVASPPFDGTSEQANRLVADFALSQVRVIVAGSTTAARAAMRSPFTIPVVFAGLADPVLSGLADTLSRPERHGTGVSVVATELYPKRLEMLHLLVPRAKRIAYLRTSSNPDPRLLTATRAAARKLGVQLQTYDAPNLGDMDSTLTAIRSGGAEALMVGGNVASGNTAEKIARFARTAKLPAVFPYRGWHEHNVIMSYGPNLREVGLRAASYVDKILKGAQPGALPIEQMAKYELVINLRVARELGIKVPQELLQRADELLR
jgi:putative ABC transport system substrate-binding protein